MQKTRCAWVTSDPEYIQYHDNEWGHPLLDSLKLFELLNLECMQAGLSWITILKKREAYRRAFANFNPDIIAKYDEAKISELLQNSGIIRNRLKINAIINNAKAYLNLYTKKIDFSEYIWSFVNYEPIINNWPTQTEVPTTTPLSDKLTKSLKKHGFKFVGSTTCYAFMQAAGLVNDHTTDCFCR